MKPDFDIAIVGSGFAGSLLARLLARAGRSVVLVEAARHPRFALGESSTPLAAIALERIAQEYGLPELANFAAYGRWQDQQPELRCGLKRGFSFYGHTRGQSYRNGPGDPCRLLVAASPNDAVADTHWLRADVDARFAQRAVEDGVTMLQEHRLTAADARDEAIELSLRTAGGSRGLLAGFAVDASGGALADALGIGSRTTCSHATTLLYAHFLHGQPFAEQLNPAERSTAPYPETLAANHHLFDGGWIYLLPFDNGRVSAGALLENWLPHRDPQRSWRRLLAQLPSLAECFAQAVCDGDAPLRQLRFRRRTRLQASGARWALLPQACGFQDPMYSTGIAWSLLAVERLAGLLAQDPRTADGQAGLARYGTLLLREAVQVNALCRGARAHYGDFDRFVEWARLYFIAASYCEARQRFVRPPAACWEGFLGATDPLLGGVFGRAEAVFAATVSDIRKWLAESLAERDVGGFTDPTCGRLIPVDLQALVNAAPRLGLDSAELSERLPGLLRGEWGADAGRMAKVC